MKKLHKSFTRVIFFFCYFTTFISRMCPQKSILLFKWIPHFRLIDVCFINLTNTKNICLHRTLKQQYLYYIKEIFHFKFLIMKNKNFDNKVKKTLKKKSSISPHLKNYLKNFTTGQNCLKREIS